MGNQKILKLVQRFKKALENVPVVLVCEPNRIGSDDFPQGWCGEASALLAAFLTDNENPGALRIHGEFGGEKNEIESHVWLALDDLIIDITANQKMFNEYKLETMVQAKKAKFYQSFDLGTTEPPLADFRVYYQGNPKLLTEFKIFYTKILEYLSSD